MALNIKQIISIIVIIAVFGIIIYFVAKTFAHQCPDGQHYDTTQKKCIINCNQNTQVYNQKTQQCRKKCDEDDVWSDSFNECKHCGISATWDENQLECISSCQKDSDCVNGQYCVSNRCCNHPSCKTKEGDTCCQEGNCNTDPNNPEYSMCCSKLQMCNIDGVTKCCPIGEVCKNNACVVPCGPEGKGVSCDTGSKCLKVQNVKPGTNMYKELSTRSKASEMNRDGTFNFFSCFNQNDVCSSGPVFAAPAAVDNFYPCFDIQKLTKDTGLGFCSYDKAVGSLAKCAALNTDDGNAKNNCDKDKDCKWHDILNYNKSNVSELNDKIKQTFNSFDGMYCNPEIKNENPGRLYGLTFDHKSGLCSYENCVSAVANPTVVDIYYDASTGNCTSLQSCVDVGDYIVNSQNKSLAEIIPNCSGGGDSDDKENKANCSNFKKDKKICDKDGLIKDFGWQCNKEGIKTLQKDLDVGRKSGWDDNGNCICNSDFDGPNCEYPRIPCNGHGYLKDGKCVMDPPEDKKCDAFYEREGVTSSYHWKPDQQNPDNCVNCHPNTLNTTSCCLENSKGSNFQGGNLIIHDDDRERAPWAESHSTWTCTWDNPHP